MSSQTHWTSGWYQYLLGQFLGYTDMTYGFAMTTIRQDFFAPGLAMFLLVLMCYIAGRVHQFFKQTTEREQAYRDGYNHATRALFALATRTAKGLPPPPLVAIEARPDRSKPGAMKGYASVPAQSRSPLPPRHRSGERRKTNLADTNRFTDWPGYREAA